MNCFLAIALLIAVLGVHSTEAIKCYVCGTSGTTDACFVGGTELEDTGSKYQTSTVCASYDRCTVSKTDTFVTRSCTSEAICDQVDGNNGISCCEGDYCNGGSTVYVNFMFMAAALLATLLFQKL